MQTLFRTFECDRAINNVLWRFYLRFVSEKIWDETKEKQEITCLNKFSVSFTPFNCSPSSAKHF